MCKIRSLILVLIGVVPFFSSGQPVDCNAYGLYFEEFNVTQTVCRNQLPFDNGNGQLVAVVASITDPAVNITYLWTENSTNNQSSNSTWGNRNPGYYSLVATALNGCAIDTTFYLDSLSPRALFEASSSNFTTDYNGASPIEVTFTNNSLNYAFSQNQVDDTVMIWDFGSENGVYQTESLSPLTRIFTSNGAHKVCLRVIENLNGCVDSTCIDLNIGTAELVENCEEVGCESEFILYPNPSTGSFNVLYDIRMDEPEAKLIVKDVNGKLVFTKQISTEFNNVFIYDLNLDCGIYYVNIVTPLRSGVSKKLIIN